MNNLADRLKYLIEERNLNAKSLSLTAGLNETAIGDILRGRSKNPRIDTLKKIADALDVHHQWLLDGFGNVDQKIIQTLHLKAYDSIVDGMPEPDLYMHRLINDGDIYQMKAEICTDENYRQRLSQVDLILYAPNNHFAPRFHFDDLLIFDSIKTITGCANHDIICAVSADKNRCQIGVKSELNVTVDIPHFYRLSSVIFS